MKGLKFRLPFLLCCVLAVSLFAVPASSMAKHKHKPKTPDWCFVDPEPEVGSEFYTSIPYSQIAPRLCEIQRTSDRVSVEVIGQSAGGRNLFLVTITNPMDKKRKRHKDKGHHKDLRKLMIRDPEKALALIEDYDDFNVPVFINGSIHGGEYPGTDACMRLIELLAYDDSDEVQTILDNVILLINVVQNPDGRVLGTRRNANDIDINRDLITHPGHRERDYRVESHGLSGPARVCQPHADRALHPATQPQLRIRSLPDMGLGISPGHGSRIVCPDG